MKTYDMTFTDEEMTAVSEALSTELVNMRRDTKYMSSTTGEYYNNPIPEKLARRMSVTRELLNTFKDKTFR
jgi:hypothetical protein